MKKIIINACYGGFELSFKAKELILNKLGVEFVVVEEDETVYGKVFTDPDSGYELWDFDLPRDNKILVDVVQLLGSEANGENSELKVVEIPNNVKWQIQDYEGKEWVSEVHRTWR